MAVTIIILAIIVLIIIIGIALRSGKDKWSPKNGRGLRPRAKVTGFTCRPSGAAKIKTVVTFDDGFKYTSYYANTRDVGISAKEIYVDNSVKAYIIETATRKHDSLLRVYTG